MSETIPLITIGITCFNAEDSIEAAIKSAKAQDYERFEIIVVDDCSTDISPTILKEQKNITVIFHEKNTGPGGARQTLISNARGEYIAFFDDDDISKPERVRIQYEHIKKAQKEFNTDLIACYCSGERAYPNGYTVNLKSIGRKETVPHGALMADHILYYGSKQKDWCYGGTPSCSLMCKTDIIKSLGGFDSAFRRVEDLDFAIRLALAGGYFIGTEQNLFRQNATFAGDKTAKKNVEAELQLVEKYKEYLIDKKKYYYARHWPILRYHHFERDYSKFLFVLIGLLIHHPISTLRQLIGNAPKRFVHELKVKKSNVNENTSSI